MNVGKRCNQACRHCHVDASPTRTEVMPDDVVDACIDVLARDAALETLDITGGRPGAAPPLPGHGDRGPARWAVTSWCATT